MLEPDLSVLNKLHDALPARKVRIVFYIDVLELTHASHAFEIKTSQLVTPSVQVSQVDGVSKKVSFDVLDLIINDSEALQICSGVSEPRSPHFRQVVIVKSKSSEILESMEGIVFDVDNIAVLAPEPLEAVGEPREQGPGDTAHGHVVDEDDGGIVRQSFKVLDGATPAGEDCRTTLTVGVDLGCKEQQYHQKMLHAFCEIFLLNLILNPDSVLRFMRQALNILFVVSSE